MPPGTEKVPYLPSEEPSEGLEPIDVKSLSPFIQIRIDKILAMSPVSNPQEVAHMVVAERDGIAMEKGISPEEAEKLMAEE